MKYFIPFVLLTLLIFSCEKREAQKPQAVLQKSAEPEQWKYDHRMMIRLNERGRLFATQGRDEFQQEQIL